MTVDMLGTDQELAGLARAVNVVLANINDRTLEDRVRAELEYIGIIPACPCGWRIGIDQMGEPCEACGLIPAIDFGHRCRICAQPIFHGLNGWHHGRRGGAGIDHAADARHRLDPLEADEMYCGRCTQLITLTATNTLVHVGGGREHCEEPPSADEIQ